MILYEIRGKILKESILLITEMEIWQYLVSQFSQKNGSQNNTVIPMNPGFKSINLYSIEIISEVKPIGQPISY